MSAGDIILITYITLIVGGFYFGVGVSVVKCHKEKYKEPATRLLIFVGWPIFLLCVLSRLLLIGFYKLIWTDK